MDFGACAATHEHKSDVSWNSDGDIHNNIAFLSAELKLQADRCIKSFFIESSIIKNHIPSRIAYDDASLNSPILSTVEHHAIFQSVRHFSADYCLWFGFTVIIKLHNFPSEENSFYWIPNHFNFPRRSNLNSILAGSSPVIGVHAVWRAARVFAYESTSAKSSWSSRKSSPPSTTTNATR